jgi:DNA/RNA-binding domain of Phe-tRNA-synthetase-like protein
MLQLSIDPALKTLVPGLAVGAIRCGVQNSAHDDGLWREIEGRIEHIIGSLRPTMDQVRRLPAVDALRKAYKTLGSDPMRYRVSSEALFRRLLKGRGLYRVNTVVDIINLVSLETHHSLGVFDRQTIDPPIVFRRGLPGESYAGIGRGAIPLEGLPVFADRQGPFGSTTSDSERTMVRVEATQILLVVISALGPEALPGSIDRAVAFLKRYAQAEEVATSIVG